MGIFIDKLPLVYYHFTSVLYYNSNRTRNYTKEILATFFHICNFHQFRFQNLCLSFCKSMADDLFAYDEQDGCTCDWMLVRLVVSSAKEFCFAKLFTNA